MVGMRMALSQPSGHMVFLILLDREARDWYHTMQLHGHPAPSYLPAEMAKVLVTQFIDEGGTLATH